MGSLQGVELTSDLSNDTRCPHFYENQQGFLLWLYWDSPGGTRLNLTVSSLSLLCPDLFSLMCQEVGSF